MCSLFGCVEHASEYLIHEITNIQHIQTDNLKETFNHCDFCAFEYLLSDNTNLTDKWRY